ncbi:MAG: 1-deoxy-D-xylulose-5-phosphate reductoisomerase [Pseudomonadota bacterium]|jgi:1-deoxy-D-xylulose-5-phosphate reductoisomerase
MTVTARQARLERRRVSILGATGSVGRSTIDLIARAPERYQVVALTAHGNVARLAEQARRLRPEVAVIGQKALAGELAEALAGTGIAIAAGEAAIAEAAALPADWVMAAIVGAAGLAPTLAAVRTGGIVALANKETLVCAGAVFTREVARAGAKLLPVDSEHNAIYQVFDFDRPERVSRVLLTASGGPFRTWSAQEMAGATPQQAVAHPNWSMGAKISVDSATLMNKGLELIEAYHLFPIAESQIEIIVHPQSVIHSMVEYIDGSVLAQMGTPDMRTPIGYALGWPDRVETPSPRLDLPTLGQLTFETPDVGRFPALDCAREALRAGGAAPAILNAANEVAVAGFLARRISFLDIVTIVRETLERLSPPDPDELEEVMAVDRQARACAERLVALRG